MPGCIHSHRHAAWPNRGPLVICPGERTCGFCEGEAAAVKFASAGALRRHVFGEHTDGGKGDFGGVEVMMCGEPREVRRSRGKAEKTGRRTRAQQQTAPAPVQQPETVYSQQQYREGPATHDPAYQAYVQPGYITPQAAQTLLQQTSLPPPPAPSAPQAFHHHAHQAYLTAAPPSQTPHQPLYQAEAIGGLYTYAPSYSSDYDYYSLQQQSFSPAPLGQWSAFDPIIMPAAPQGYRDVPRIFQEAQVMQGSYAPPDADDFVPQQQQQMSPTSLLGAIGREWVWRRAGSGVLEQ